MQFTTRKLFPARSYRPSRSSCLLGQEVRYNGGHKRDRFLVSSLSQFVDYVPVGTANLDNRSFRLNFEIALAFAHAGFAAEIADMLERDFAQCDEIGKTDVRHLPLLTRIGASTARLLAPVL